MNVALRSQSKWRTRLLRLGVALGCALVWLGVTLPLASAQPWEEAYPGVRYLSQTRPGPIEVRAVEVDLCADGVSFRATKESENWQTTSSFGAEVGAQVAINGDFYSWPPDTLGMAMGAGEHWSPDTSDWGFVAFGDGNAQLSPPGNHVPDPPAWMEDVVGGNIMVLTDGVTTSDQGDFCLARHPRTMVGFSEDGTKAYLAVADGRNPGTSIGMTCAEIGDFMRDLGAHHALNLDGGGSTTMWRDDMGVVNTPSDEDGERLVVNHLAVHADGSGAARSCPEQDWDIEIDARFPNLDVIHGDGDASDVVDALVGDQFQAEILVSNQSDQVIRDVWAGYWFEAPFLEGRETTIYTDHPEYDQQTWVVNDANESPNNPEAGQLGQEGALELFAFSPGETKRVVVDMEATQYSIGMADHPDVRTWIRSIENIYGLQDGFWGEPDAVNQVGQTLRGFAELDVVAPDHWHFASHDSAQIEGWRRCDGSAEGLEISGEFNALSVSHNGTSICLKSPEWTRVNADTYDQLVVATPEGDLRGQWTVHWRSNGDASSHRFDTTTITEAQAIVFSLGEDPRWTGEIEELRLSMEHDEAVIGEIFVQSSQGQTSTPYAEFSDVLPATSRNGDPLDSDQDDVGGQSNGEPNQGDYDGAPDTGESSDDSDTSTRSSCGTVASTPVGGWLAIMLICGVAILRRP